MNLNERMESLAQRVLDREARHEDDLAAARAKATSIHARVEAAIAVFNEAVAQDLPQLRVDVTPIRIDDKHLHAYEFDLDRGRIRAIVTIKSKAEVTLVGPFRQGKNEGPCRTFPFREERDLDDALSDFLERFLEDATAP